MSPRWVGNKRYNRILKPKEKEGGKKTNEEETVEKCHQERKARVRRLSRRLCVRGALEYGRDRGGSGDSVFRDDSGCSFSNGYSEGV